MNIYRGDVNLEVYLPPKWKKEGSTYPVIFFLHGALGNEKGFFNNVEYEQLNNWIKQGELPPFVLISAASHYVAGVEQQWSSIPNESFLTSRANTELRAFSLKHFHAGDMGRDTRKTSIRGHSRGALSALHYGLKFPTLFTSAIANAFVTDHALEEEQQNALHCNTKIPLSLVILKYVYRLVIRMLLKIIEKHHPLCIAILIPLEFRTNTNYSTKPIIPFIVCGITQEAQK